MKNIFNIKSKLSCFVMQRSCSLMEWHPECSSVGGTVVQNTPNFCLRIDLHQSTNQRLFKFS